MKIYYDPSEDSVEMVVARGKRNSRANAFLLTVIGCFFSLMGVIAVLISPFTVLGVAFSAATAFIAYYGARDWIKCRRGEPLPVWLSIEKEQQKTLLPFEPTRSFGESIRKVYQTNPQEETLSLPQSVQLFHVYIGQQKRLKTIEIRLGEINKLHQEMAEKLAQLQALGAAHPGSSSKLERIIETHENLEADKKQIQNSCRRLEAIVASAQNAAQIRKLHRELDELGAQASQPIAAIEPAFEAESLEDIERQIGREIETYLQLERETEEQLR